MQDLKQTTLKFFDQYFSAIRQRLPAPVVESCIGLDIGVRFCKAVELMRTKKGLKILNFVIEPVQNTDVLSSVKKTLEKIGSDSKEVYTAVSGQGTLIRFIKMPRMPITQLKESLQLEADKYFPFSASDIYMDCQILDDERAKDNKMSIMVAVAKKEIIKERLQLINTLGLQGNFIGLNALALANAVIEFQQEFKQEAKLGERKQAFALIDIGEAKTTVIIFRDNAPRFTREIAIGAKDLTQKIAGALGCPMQEAEAIKCQPGIRSDEVSLACQPVFSSLISEIRLSFDYFSSEDGAQVVKVFLTGGTSSFVKIKDFFAQELEMSSEIWKPSVKLEFSDKISSEEFFAKVNQIPVALGLSVMRHD